MPISKYKHPLFTSGQYSPMLAVIASGVHNYHCSISSASIWPNSMWVVDLFTTLNSNADCRYSSFIRSSVFLLTSISHLAMQVTNNNNFCHLIYYRYNIRNIQACCCCTQHWCIMIYGLTIPSHPLTLPSCTKSLAYPSSSTHQWCMSLGRSLLWPLGVFP